MNVTLVGRGPAADAVAAALTDTDASVHRGGVDLIGDAALAVVCGRAGADGFARANAIAHEHGVPWLAVEWGGIGGVTVDGVRVSVAGIAPQTGCYECLRTRVEANLDGDANADQSVESPPDARLAGALAGREAASLLAGEESTILGGIVEIPYTERRFLPVPGCSTCADSREEGLPLSHRDRGVEEALAAAEQALDSRAGLISEVGEVESFPVPYYLSTVADTSDFSDAVAASNAAGVDTDWNAAFMKALGEGLERYSAGVYRKDTFRMAAPGAVEGTVPPSAFVGVESDGDEPIPWIGGAELDVQDVVETTDVWLPAEFVHFPPPEHRYGQSITTGLGLQNSTIGAVLSGLYEVMERDATMIAWYSTFEPLELAVEDEGFEALVQRARGVGLTVTPLLVTQDVDVPVVAVAVHRPAEWPKFAMGSGADLDPASAARSALAEALQNFMELRALGPEDAADESGAIGRYADFPAATRNFVDVETTIPADSVGPDEPLSGEEELASLVSRVRDAGLTPYVSRLTPRDVESLGFEAVRVLVPEAQPLFTEASVFGERARLVPESLGFESDLDREFHPYP